MEVTPAWWQRIDATLTTEVGAELISTIASAGYSVESLGELGLINDTSVTSVQASLERMVHHGNKKQWTVGQQDFHFWLR